MKELLAKEEDERDAAIDIAIRAGALRSCEHHGEVFRARDSVGDDEMTAAYRVGNAGFSRGKFKGIFDSRLEMTDTIKAVVDEFVLRECPICSKMLRD